jgi:HK97 gp10 family phage protein
MATLSVHVKVTSHIPQLSAAVKQKAELAVTKAAADIEAQAKVRAPVDTGLLKNSIQSRREGDLRHIVESPVHYSVYQEFGTRKMPAQPFMLPAVEFVKPSFEMAMRSLVR